MTCAITIRSPGIAAWDSLDADHKQVFAHMMEVYAGALSHCDYHMGRILDAIEEMGATDNTLVIYLATGNTPAMVLKMIGLGSQYAYAAVDKDGNYLDGSKTYKLNIPANVPAKDFWSVCLYDPQTRSLLQTSPSLAYNWRSSSRYLAGT